MKNYIQITRLTAKLAGGILVFAIFCAMGSPASGQEPVSIRLIEKGDFDGYKLWARFKMIDQRGQPVAFRKVRVTTLLNGRGVKSYGKSRSGPLGFFRSRVNSRWSHPADHAEMIVDFFGDDQYQRTQLRVNWPRVTGS